MKLVDGVPTVFPVHEVDAADNLLVTVYDRGPVEVRLGCHFTLKSNISTG